MKNKYLLLLCALLVGGLFSCSNKGNSPLIIIGNWNLQQQHAVRFVDGLVVKDTVFNASNLTYAYAQFNADNTFSSKSVYVPANYLQSLSSTPGGASTVGTYSYTNNVLTMKPGLAGWFIYAVGSSTLPITGSGSLAISKITLSNLDIHTEGSYSYTNATGAHTDKVVTDFYYTR